MGRARGFVHALAVLACTGLVLPLGCERRSSRAPREAAAPEGILELVRLREDIRDELDTALQPIAEVDFVIDRVTTLPERIGVEASAVGALARALLAGEAVTATFDAELSEAERAELAAAFSGIRSLADALRATPERSTKAGARIGVLASTAADLASALTREVTTKSTSPFSTDDEKWTWALELSRVTQLASRIETEANEARTAVRALPQRSSDALARLDAAFAGLERP